VKEFLSQKGVSYKEIEISRDPEAEKEVVRISGRRSVPVIVIDGDVIVGFDRRALEEKLR